MIKIGDIVKSRFYQGYDTSSPIDTGPYRVIKINQYDGYEGIEKEFLGDDQRDVPHFCYTVVPTWVEIGKERSSDHHFLNNYEPSLHPKIMRSIVDRGYLLIQGYQPGIQQNLF